MYALTNEQQIQVGNAHLMQRKPKIQNVADVVKWVDRCQQGDSFLKVMKAMEAEIKELRELVNSQA